jgi:hypothetical protein
MSMTFIFYLQVEGIETCLQFTFDKLLYGHCASHSSRQLPVS